MMSLVTVYHGTSLDRKESIWESTAINTTNDENKRYDNTTRGFVYVTKRLCDALDFSSRPMIKEKGFLVFKIRIDDSDLSADLDEKKWESTLSENGTKDCYKIGHDLLFGREVISYFEKRVDNTKEIGEFMQSVQYNEILIADDEWIPIK